MMSLRQIEVFRTVMVAGTVHGAAAMLHVSQPGLSRLLRHVEDQLGVALFERRKGRLAPTAEARSLFEEIEPIFRQIEQLKVATQRIVNGEGETLRVAASPSVGRHIVPATLARLDHRKRKIAIHFDILPVDQVVDYLTWRRGEAVVTIFPVDHPMVESKVVGKGSLVAAIPLNSPLASKEVIALTDLQAHEIIGFEKHTPHGTVISKLFAACGLSYSPNVRVRFAESACALTELGVGVSIVDELTTMGDVFAGLVTRPIVPTESVEIHLNTSSASAASVGLRLFERTLTDVIGRLGIAVESD